MLVATLEHPEQQAFLSSEPNDKQAHPFDCQRSRLAFLSAFWFGIASLLIDVSALVAIAITLAKFDRKEQPAWKYSVDLNTLIAILSTLLRVWVLYGVEEGMVQVEYGGSETDY